MINIQYHVINFGLTVAASHAFAHGRDSINTRLSALSRVVMLVAVWLLMSLNIASAATLTVTTLNDDGPGSLRQAVIDAVAGDLVTFASTLDGQTILLTGAAITIDKNITIDGGMQIIIDANSNSRHFLVRAGTVTIQNIVLQNGNAPVTGGSINITEGARLTINNSSLIANVSGLSGGGIRNSGTLTVINSTIRDNIAGTSGGGIRNFGTQLTVIDSTVSNNTAGVDAGGIYNDGDGHNSRIINSTISGNTGQGEVAGGGITEFSIDGRTEIINSTIKNNMSDNTRYGKQIDVFFGGNFIVTDSIIEGIPSSNDCVAAIGVISYEGTSFSNSSSCAGATLSTDINLGPLADNGCTVQHATPDGPACVKTHALLDGSEAIDALDTTMRATDQRGIPRPQGSLADAGAFEVEQQLEILLSSASVSEADGSAAGTATVTRSFDSPSDLVVTLTGNDPSEATVPATVTIAAGERSSPPFEISAIDDAILDGDQSVEIRATASGFADGTVTIMVRDDESDSDNDTVIDDVDNCPLDANADQLDLDMDSIGDVCDDDFDGDGVPNAEDNCPLANPGQADFEGDGTGDACDPDTDGDGLPNDYEVANGLNPFNSFDRDADPDRDGFSNRDEFGFGTNPQVADSDLDGNGIPDVVDNAEPKALNIIPMLHLLLSDD